MTGAVVLRKLERTELVPDTTYRVEFEDCCAAGHFIGVFKAINRHSDDDDGFESLEFENGSIGPDWGSWAVYEVDQ